MSKAAVAGLTRGLARDLGPRGITVNVVQPGPVDTDMNPATGPFSEVQKLLDFRLIRAWPIRSLAFRSMVVTASAPAGQRHEIRKVSA